MDSNSLASTGSSIANSLSSALGYSTGIDTAALVSSLVSAARSARSQPINSQLSVNNARISALASAKSSLTTFSTALTELLKTSNYSGQPASNDPSIASVSLLSAGTGVEREVTRLATSQILRSADFVDDTALAGTGTLTLTVGGTSTNITLADPNSSLADLASAINDANTGVTATIVTDGNGAHLKLEGPTGASNAFTLTDGGDADADLLRFAYSGTDSANMTRSQSATDSSSSVVGGDGNPVGLPAQLVVNKLAAAQVVQSSALANGSALAGTGTMIMTVNGTATNITVGPGTTLAGFASAINAAKTGVTASVVTDKTGARLVLKGATGEDNAFTFTAGAGADASLQRFVYNGANTATMTRSQQASDAEITIDNIAMKFSSNEITTAIPNLRIDLNKAAPGTTVTLATNQPTTTMSELVQDFVANYNTLRTALNTATSAPTGNTSATAGSSGTLSSDNGIRAMKDMLAKLTTTDLSSDGPYKKLTDIGIKTNRDGTLSLDTVKLNAALADNSAAVTEMLNPTVPDATHPGLGGALKSITDYLTGSEGPLATSQSIYDKLKTQLQTKLDKLDEDMASYEEQLNRDYSVLQTRLLQFKATQSYLTAQIDAWNNS